jgi:hypothetical protein
MQLAQELQDGNMTIYVCKNATTRVEFIDEQAAIEYAASNNMGSPTTEEKESPVTIEPIASVSPRQIRLALVSSGIPLDTIESFINSLEEPTKTMARIAWEYSTAFERYNELVEQLGAAMGLTSTQLDDLWRMAGSL